MPNQKVVIALGGNAIHNKGERGTYEEQLANVRNMAENLLDILADKNYDIVIVHGNGPQVGNLLIQNDAAQHTVPAMPMFLCGAMTQGQIGHFIQRSIIELFKKNNVDKDVTTVVTHVEVDKSDPAFKNPTKPVGPFYTKEDAEKLAQETGYTYQEDAGRGHRRFVASPNPKSIVEIGAIKKIMDSGIIVIASGGGGIPVSRENGSMEGVNAVIDKDRTASLMCDLLDADIFIVLTGSERVALFYKTDKEKLLDILNVNDALNYLSQDFFDKGSMGPKIEAAANFVVKKPHRKALITHPSYLKDALQYKNGTWIVHGAENRN